MQEKDLGAISSPSSRRRFLSGASVGAAAAAAMVLGARPALANITKVKRAPLATPIVDFLVPEHQKMLTPAAAKLSKKDLADLRHYIKTKKGTPPNISVDDMNSIENAFDSSELAQHAKLGYKVAGMPLGVKTAEAGDITACCSCCSCCSTAAAVTRPAGTL